MRERESGLGEKFTGMPGISNVRYMFIAEALGKAKG